MARFIWSRDRRATDSRLGSLLAPVVLRPQARETSQRLERGDLSVADRRMQVPRVAIQPVALLAQQRDVDGLRWLSLPSGLHGPRQFAQHRLALRLVAVELKTSVAETHPVQVALDHAEGSHLLGHEEDGPAVADGLGDDVGDRLRLAGPRRSPDDQVRAAVDGEDGTDLRAVGLDDLVALLRVHEVVDVGAVRQRLTGLRDLLALNDQSTQHRVGGDVGAGRPTLWIEVVIHEELGEGEEAQAGGFLVDAPARLAAHRVAHSREVVGDVGLVGVDVLALEEIGEAHAEILVQLAPQTQVVADLVVAVAQDEAVAGARALKLDRHQYERRAAQILTRIRFVPLEIAQSQEERVHALFFEEGAGVVERAKEAPLKLLRSQRHRQRACCRPAFPPALIQRERRLHRAEAERLPLLDQLIVDSSAVDRLHDDAATALPEVQQRVAERHIEQVPSRRLEAATDVDGRQDV